MEAFWDSISDFSSQHGITTLVMLALANFLIGVAAAIYQRKFKWFYVGDILRKTGPIVIVYVAVNTLLRNADLAATVLGIATVDFLGAITKNVLIFTGGTTPTLADPALPLATRYHKDS